MIEFHVLKETDIEIIVPMMQEFYAIDNYPFDQEMTKKLFQTFIANEDLGNCWLISNQQNFVGYVILTYVFSFEYRGKIAFLDELYVNEKARGKGIGKAALQFVHEEALKNDLKIIYLEMEFHNEKAKNLYLKNGFKLHKRQILKRITKP